MSLPLEGKRVLVTRAAHQAGRLSEGLRALGAEPVEVPVLEIQPPESFAALDEALRQLENYDWLILSSANTVRVLEQRRPSQRVDFSVFTRLKVAAVGQATVAAARNVGFRITVVPETYVAESLVNALTPQIQGQRVLLARAAIARDVIPDALRAAGASVDVVDAYTNVLPAPAPALLRQALAHGLDAATFTSSSSVTHLSEAARIAGCPWPPAQIPAISIGPITSETLVKMGWPPAAEANPFDIPGLIAAVVQALGPR